MDGWSGLEGDSGPMQLSRSGGVCRIGRVCSQCICDWKVRTADRTGPAVAVESHTSNSKHSTVQLSVRSVRSVG